VAVCAFAGIAATKQTRPVNKRASGLCPIPIFYAVGAACAAHGQEREGTNKARIISGEDLDYAARPTGRAEPHASSARGWIQREESLAVWSASDKKTSAGSPALG
jgi:hypothetical protein